MVVLSSAAPLPRDDSSRLDKDGDDGCCRRAKRFGGTKGGLHFPIQDARDDDDVSNKDYLLRVLYILSTYSAQRELLSLLLLLLLLLLPLSLLLRVAGSPEKVFVEYNIFCVSFFLFPTRKKNISLSLETFF